MLFAPDELQAFRTDNVVGILQTARRPARHDWPSVAEYRDAVPGTAPARRRAAGEHVRRARDRRLRARGVGGGVVVVDPAAEFRPGGRRETWKPLSAVNGSRANDPQRDSSSSPASCAMRSSSGGAANRSLRVHELTPSDWVIRTWVVSDRLRVGVVDRRIEPHAVDTGFAARSTSSPRSIRDVSGTNARRRKRPPPGSRCAATLRKHRTCSACDVSMKNVLNTTNTSENSPSTATSAMSPSVVVIASPPGLGAQSLDHRRRRVDAVHLDAERGERESRPGRCRCRARAHDRRRRARRATRASTLRFEVAVPLVVDVGDVLAVGFGVVLVHRAIEADPGREAAMKIDAALTTTASIRRGRGRARARSAGLRRRLHLRRPARSVLPVAPRGGAHRAVGAHDRGRDRVRAQPDDARELRPTTCSSRRRAGSTSGSARRSSRTSRSGSRCRGHSPPPACARWCSRSGRSGRAGTRARSSTSAASSTRTR